MIQLRHPTESAWTKIVLADLDSFLLDHAAAERKASAMAMTFVVRYPDRDAIHEPMIQLAREELTHFHRVFKVCRSRGLRIGRDSKDPYVNGMLQTIGNGHDEEFLDRLLMAGVVEARGHERFGLVAAALPAGELKEFYEEITASEARHADLFVELAAHYFEPRVIEQRLERMLAADARLVATLPHRAALH